MRLSEQERLTLKRTIRQYFGENTSILLFGSRADDTKKGGDIDIYIECDTLSSDEVVNAKINALLELYKTLGEQKIDLVINRKNGFSLPIYDLAKREGVPL
ncbi:MAG: putative nucleotidyltransferase [Oleiphilaceae bacterium]|jgi:predicted nucleotidyltransferase